MSLTTQSPIDLAKGYADATVDFYTSQHPESENVFAQASSKLAMMCPQTLRLSELYTRQAVRGSLSKESMREMASLEQNLAAETLVMA